MGTAETQQEKLNVQFLSRTKTFYKQVSIHQLNRNIKICNAKDRPGANDYKDDDNDGYKQLVTEKH